MDRKLLLILCLSVLTAKLVVLHFEKEKQKISFTVGKFYYVRYSK